MTSKTNPKGRNPLEDALSTAPWGDYAYFALRGSGASVQVSNKGGAFGAAVKQNGNSQTTTTTSSSTTTTTTTSSTKSIIMMSPVLKPPAGNTGTPTDSNFSKQWNLTSTTAGIRVMTVWQNYTGLGVKIGVIDDGVDYTHQDLAPHYLFAKQYDAVTPDGSAFGTSADKHGTTVSGVIAAARNGAGVVGVAYNAGIAGIRIGYGSSGNPTQYADALNHLVTNGLDIGNNSWGYSTAFQDNFNSYWSSSRAALLNDVQAGRGGLGTSVVFSAGNGRGSGDNVNYHNYQNSPYVITVASTDANGKFASSSSPGAAVLVSAPGVGITTDDRVGSLGYSSTDYVTVSGTSFSAPTVSGVIALMLQANPKLGYRDVQQILAYSSRQTDPTNAGWKFNGATNWNGGGLHFSHDYGFGLVDTTAAVRLAESWNMQSTYADMSSLTQVHTDNLSVVGGGSIQSKINLTTPLSIQKMVVSLNLTDSNVSGLTISLASPSGTTAVLASHPTKGAGSGIVFDMSANNFWGENSIGTWTLTIANSLAGNTAKLNGWTLTGFGNAYSTLKSYIYTDEFATAPSTVRVTLRDTSGTATINAAAVTSACKLDLRPGAVDTIAGRSLTIGTDTLIRNLWAGDGNDMIFCNDAGDAIQGGRGNDTITAGGGKDVLSGGPGNDTFVFKSPAASFDVISDFAVGSDIVDMRPLLASMGYKGVNAVADQWLGLISDGHGGTNFVINPHNGSASSVALDALNIVPTALRPGIDLLT